MIRGFEVFPTGRLDGSGSGYFTLIVEYLQ